MSCHVMSMSFLIHSFLFGSSCAIGVTFLRMHARDGSFVVYLNCISCVGSEIQADLINDSVDGTYVFE